MFARSVPFLSTLLILIVFGCTNSEGHRITAREWLSGGWSATDETPPPGPSGAESAATPTANADKRVPPARPAGPNAIRAGTLQIYDEFITVNDILEPLGPRIQELASTLPPRSYYEQVAELIRQQLFNVVGQHLIYHRASQDFNEQMETGIERAVDRMEEDRINREFGGRETSYTNYLQEHGKDRAAVRERLRRAIVADSYLRERLRPMIHAPRKRELLNYYQAHLAEYSSPERRELYLIDIPTAAYFERFPPRPTDVPLAEQKARNAIEAANRALAAGRPFEDVAKEFSAGIHKDDGGAWGVVGSPMAGRWETPYKRFVRMSEGQISPIIEVEHDAPRGITMKSFFIVKVGGLEHAQVLSFQEAQPKIMQRLKERSFQRLRSEFLQNQLDQAHIGSLDEFGKQIMAALPQPAFSRSSPITNSPAVRR